MPRNRAGFSVEIPSPEQDRPRFGRVGIIAAVGFAVGVLWPRLAGVQLAPSAPLDDLPVAEGNASAAPPKPANSGISVAKVARRKSEKKPAEVADADRLTLGEPLITSCRDEKGKRQIHCGKLNLESVVPDKLRLLAACPAAKKARGKLSVGLQLDFSKKKIVDIKRGKSTTLSDAIADELLECAEQAFSNVSIAQLARQHVSYTVFYVVDFAPPKSGDSTTDVREATGSAVVAWEVAIIREAPKEGAIVARILRGTRVVVTGKKRDWYRVKYDAKGSEGWVYRSAVGL